MKIVQIKTKRGLVGVLAVLTVVLVPFYGSADTVEIFNSIQSSANTGGNSAEPGQNVQTGKASAEVRIQTTVNNQEVESIEEEVKTTGSAEVRVEQEIKVDNETVESNTNIKTSPGSETSQESTQEKNTQEDNSKTKENSSFFATIVSIFSKIQSFFTNLFT